MSNKSGQELSVRDASERDLREVTIENVVHDLTTIQKEDVYYAKGKKGYSAKVYRMLAIEQGIRTSIVEYGKDADKAWVKVEAWKGDRQKPDAYGEAVVIQRHQDTLRESIFDAIANGMTITEGWDKVTRRPIQRKVTPEFTVGDDGFPRLTNPQHMFQLMKNHLHEISIIERKLATIATRNATRNCIEEPESDDEESDDKTDRRLERRNYEDDEPSTDTKQSSANAQGKKEQTPEQREFVLAKNDIGKIVMDICDGDKELAKQFFADFTGNIDGVLSTESPAKLLTLAEAKIVLTHLQSYQKPQPDAAERMETTDENALDIEPESEDLSR